MATDNSVSYERRGCRLLECGQLMSHPHPIPVADDRSPIESRRQTWFEVVLIFLIFFIQGAWPVPEVNEAHYLSKAKHYWNPQWCEHDFLCSSADAHQVFYWSFGWLTLWFTLPAVAWIGRILTWSLLAWAWRRLSFAVVPARFAAVLSAGLFLTLLHRAHLAGEWVVGGVEAKGFAFVLGLLGIEAVVRDRWNRAWLLFGAAAAFHVLVGGWLVVAAGFAWLIMRLASGHKPTNCSIWALLAGGALALPGLIPAIMLMRGVTPATATEAARIYVVERLPHHLVPQEFPWDLLLRFAVMVAVWVLIHWHRVLDDRERRLMAIVNGALAIATIGFGISFLTIAWPERATSLLRYYWFRTSDVLLPLGIGIVVTLLVAKWINQRRRAGTILLVCSLALVGWHLTKTVQERRARPIPPADRRAINYADWREMCDWAAANTPADSVFLTPRLLYTFRWYSGRAEVVSWKDVPQDAVGIVEWWRRMRDIHARRQTENDIFWYSSLTFMPPEHLVRVGKEYGATFVLTEAEPPLPFELVSPPNASYAIYRLPAVWETKVPAAE
jgi:hypothetical protein